MNKTHTQKMIRKYKLQIFKWKIFRYALISIRILPIIFFILWFIFPEYRSLLTLIISGTMLMAVFNSHGLDKAVRHLNLLKLTMIAYRYQNGERFPEGHKERALFVKMLTTLSTRKKDLIE